MARINGALYVKGRVEPLGSNHTSCLEIPFPTNKVYEIGIDQSTTCTGIAFKSTDNEIVLQMEFYSKYLGSEDIYLSHLRELLRALCKGRRIDLVVLEKPVIGGWASARSKLLPFARKVKDIVGEIPEYRGKKVEWIQKNVWTSMIRNKSKGKGRANNKREIAIDTYEMFPYSETMFKWSRDKDYGAMEALGILEGFKLKYRKTEGILDNAKVGSHMGAIFLYGEEGKVLEQFGVLVRDWVAFSREKLQYRSYNAENRLHENVKMCDAGESASVFQLNNNIDLISVLFEFDLNIIPNARMVILVTAKRNISKKNWEYLRNQGYHIRDFY